MKNKWFWGLILLIIAFITAIYFFFFSSIFWVNNVNIFGNNEIKTQDIQNVAENDITKKIFSIANWQVLTKNIFLVNTENIKKEILDQFPKIEDIVINKKLFQTLNIEIKERKPVAVFCTKDQLLPKDCYYIDENGIIFQELKELPDNFIVIWQDSENDKVYLKDKVAEKNIILGILKVQSVLKDNYNVNIIDALITTPFRLNIKTAENWQIYFATDSDLNSQVLKLDLLLKNEILESARKNLQYIDLRFKDRAYYK